MIERYREMIEATGGAIHRLEDWGRRVLAYPIHKLYKAHYVLMNIECGSKPLQELCDAFRYNDAVLRNLIVQRDTAVTEKSLLAKKPADEDEDTAVAESSTTSAPDTDGAQPTLNEQPSDSEALTTELPVIPQTPTPSTTPVQPATEEDKP